MGIAELVRLDPLRVTSACGVQLLPMGIFFSALAASGRYGIPPASAFFEQVYP